MAVSSRRRGRDLWVRPNRWRSHHPIRRAPQVSVLIHPHVFADRLFGSVAIRFPDFMITEKELRAAMSSVAPNMLVKVVDWTATLDDRHLPATIGFFVELAGDQGMASHVSVLSRVSLMKHVSRRISTSSLRSRTRAGTCARRAVTIKQKYRLGPRARLIPQTNHPTRPIRDV